MPRTVRVVLPEYQGNINLFLFDFKGFSTILERVGVRGTKCHEWRYFAPSPSPSPGGRGDPSFYCIRRFLASDLTYEYREKGEREKGDRFIYQSFFARLGEELLSKGGRLCQGLGEWYYPNIHITLFNGGITAKLCLPNRRTIDAI
jgi:hypothetical protein